MDINGYTVVALARRSAGGPLWEAEGADGTRVLVALRDAEQGEQLEERWRAWACLDSEHVVRLIDVARNEDGRWALVMERVPGETLEALLARGCPRTRAERDRILEDVEEGLEDLHGSGLTHGDVSAANIIVRPDGHAVLVDVADGERASTGTPGWSMGPDGLPLSDDEACGVVREALRNGPKEPHGGRTNTPGASVEDVLRRVALSDRTRRADAPVRHRRQRCRPRGRWLCAVVVGALVLTGGISITLVRAGAGAVAAGEAGAAAAETIESSGAASMSAVESGTSEKTVACPGSDDVRDALVALVDRRDRAIGEGEASSVEDAVSGELGAEDVALIAQLDATGTWLEGLHTEVGEIADVSCDGAIVTVSTALRQRTHRRCTEVECQEIPDQRTHHVRITLEGDPQRISEVEETE